MADEHLASRLEVLQVQLHQLGSVLVAFSGGADSAFLLAAAVRALGPDRVVAATAVSPSLAQGELSRAARFAAGLGVRHQTPQTDEMSRDGYRANAGDRCYFCKAELLDVLLPLADRLALEAVATGTNADDAVAGFRPGIRAAAERGAVTPLRDAGLTKAQVRAASRSWGLVTWDKPAAACLSSRVAYGVKITPARLARVDMAEAALRRALAAAGLTVRDLRVRDLGAAHARVEVDAALVEVLAGRPELLVEVDGFDTVEVDPRGFRSGSMNDPLATGGDGHRGDGDKEGGGGPVATPSFQWSLLAGDPEAGSAHRRVGAAPVDQDRGAAAELRLDDVAGGEDVTAPVADPVGAPGVAAVDDDVLLGAARPRRTPP